MLATLAHLVLWLALALAVVWTTSSLVVVVLAIAAMGGSRRVVLHEEELAPSPPAGSPAPLLALAPARAQRRLVV